MVDLTREVRRKVARRLGMRRVTRGLLTTSGVLVLYRGGPSNSAINYNDTLCCTLLTLRGRTTILYTSPVPNQCTFAGPHLFGNRFRPRVMITISITDIRLFNRNGNIPRCAHRISLYVSRRTNGDNCTRFALLSNDTTTTTRLLCRIVYTVRIRVAPRVTSYLCANLSASANYFGFSSAGTDARVATTGLVRTNTRIRRLGALLFSAGSQRQVRTRQVTHGRLRCRLSNHYTLVCLAQSRVRRDEMSPTSLRRLADLPVDVRNIGINLALHRRPNNDCHVDIHATGNISTYTVTQQLNNNNRAHTTNYRLLNSLRGTGGTVLTRIRTRLSRPRRRT